MSTRRSLFVFGALLVCFALLAPGVVLAQRGTTDKTPATVALEDTAADLASNVTASTYADRFDALSVGWAEPTLGADADVKANKGPITGYRVYYHTAAFARNAVAAISTTKDFKVGTDGGLTTAMIDGLKPNTTYHFRVAPMNAQGVGSADNNTTQASATVADAPDPDRVAGVEVVGGDKMLTVSWDAPYAGHASLTIAKYIVSYNTSKTATKAAGTARTIEVTASPAVIANLVNGTMYDVTVAAVNSQKKTGAASLKATGTPSADGGTTDPTDPGGTTPTAPSDVRATSSAATSIAVTWERATSPVSGYQVAWKATSVATDTIQANPPNLENVAATEASYTITGLTPSTSYRVAVRTSESGSRTAGEWEYATGLVTTSAGPALATPVVTAEVEKYGAPGRRIEVSWGSVAGATGYTVEWRKRGQSSATASESENVSGTSLTIVGPDFATDYDIRVRAMNASGNGEWSNEAQVRVDEEIEEVPVVDTTPGDAKFTVSWTAVAYATYYCVWWRPIADGPWEGDGDCTDLGGKETTMRTMTADYYYDRRSGTRKPIVNDTEYVVEVEGRNNADFGPESKVVTVTPMKATAPTVPVIEITGGDSMLTVSWEVDSAATEYHIQWRSEGQSFGAAARSATVEVEDAATMMSYDITELTNGMTYEVRVRSKNDHGTSGWSQGEAMAGTQPVPALPLFGALVLGAGLMTAGRRRLRARHRRLLKA